MRTFTGFGLLFFLFSCSALKVDSNCLNEKAGCFKPDKTAPTYKSIYPDITAAGVAELPYTDITFSEEMKGGELLENYALSGAGASSMSLASVTKVGPYTYRIYLNGSVNNGPIRIDFSKLNDYAGNSLANQTFIQYDGNTVMAVAVNAQYNRGGVSTNSGNGGYGTIAITFSHNYRSDATNNTSWYIRITPGIVDCAAGVAWHSGSDGVGTSLPPLDTNNAATQLTRTFNATDFTNPYNAIVICMTNNTNPSAKAVGQWYVRRNDSVPVVTYVPPETDDYNSPIPVTLTCSGYPFRIAVTETSQQTSSPADPTPPAFDPNTGLVTTGTSFSTATANITAQNPVNPTRTKFSWRCIDVAGNMSSAQLNAALDTRIEYYVDSSIPAVNFTPDTAYHSFVSSGGYTSSTFKFSTDQAAGEQWLIKKGGTSCTSGGTTMYSGTVVAPGATITQVVNVGGNATTDFNAVGLYDIRICVHRAANNKWGTKYLLIERDDTAPTILSSVTSGSYGAVQQVSLSCTNNADVIAFTKAVQIGKTPPATPGNPAFLADGSDSATGPITLDDSSSTIIRYQCRDKAGNFSTIQQLNYTVDSTLPNITVVSNEHAGLSNTGGYATSQLVWHSTRGGLPYEIRRGVADCTGGPGLGNANNILTGTTPAGLGNISVTLPVASFPGDGVTHDLKICVFNYIDSPTYQATVLQIKRDDTPPTFAGLQTLSSPASGSFTLGWTPAADAVTYNIYRSTPPPTFGTTPDYTAAHPNANITVSGLNPAITYYFIAGAVDAAGNETKVTAAQLASKPTITLVVNGLSGSFNIADGTASATISADQNAAWTTTLGLGQSYAFMLTSQPTGQVCSIRERQFGTLVSDLTITVNCAAGYAVAGRFQAIPAVPLNYLMHRGNVSTAYTAPSNVSGVAVIGSNLYFVQRDNGTDSSIRKCNLASSCASSLSTVVNQTTGAFRHLATDGTNLYVTRADGAASATRIYKYSALATGQTLPAAEYDLGITVGYPSGLTIDVNRNLLYIGLRNVAEIKRLRLDNGNISSLTSVVSQHEGLTLVGDDLYIATPDNGNCILKAANAHAAVSANLYAGSCGATEEYADGPLLNARFARAHALVSDGTDLYLGEFAGRRIRRINVRKGLVSTIAGGLSGSADGTGIAVSFSSPFSMATDGRALFLTDGGGRIRKIADGGLSGYWPVAANTPALDYNSSTTPLATAVSGTLTVSASDRYGSPNSAQRFTGTQNISSPSGQVALTAACDVTLAAWYRNDSLGTTQGIVYNGNSSTSGYGVIYVAGEGIKILAGSAGWLPATAGAKSYLPNAGIWTHIAARCRGSNIWTLFINGKKYFEQPLTANAPSAAGAQFTIGRDSATAFLNGSVADVRAYNRALNEGEINELAQDASASAAVTGIGFSKSATGLLSHYEIFNGSMADSGAINLPIVSTSGTVINGKDGDPNGAYSFNIAANQYLATANSTLDGTGNSGEITVAAWVNPTTLPTPGTVHIIASRWANADINRGYYLEYFNSGGTQQLYWSSSGAVASYFANVVVPLGTWSHVAVTHSGTAATIYLNGVALPTTQASPRPLTPTPNSTPIQIGRRDDGNYTNGKIDDVRVYNNALTAWQIRELATQIPHGLVARYDFTGDRSDISGYGQDLSNNGVTLTTDRFGMANAAAFFDGSSHFDGAMANYPLGNSPRTICAWTRPTNVFNGTFSEVVMYGTNGSATGWGFGMDAAGGLPNGRIFILDTVGDLAWNKPHGLHVWRHICIAYNGGTEQLIVDGYGVAAAPRTLATASGQLVIGRGIFGAGDYFNGSIDDVRIYNRVLSLTEIQTLQQQGNRRIFVTATTPTGNMGGISGADGICAADANKPVTSNVFKAMLVDTSVRIACLGSDCPSGGIPESTDWVLHPNITYTRPDQVTPIFTADFRGIFIFGTLANSFSASAGPNVWTGLIPQWVADTSTADNWTNAASTAVYGDRTSTGTAAIYSFWGTGNASLYCVEQ